MTALVEDKPEKRAAKGSLKTPVFFYKGNLVHIRWESGGEVPQALAGAYTSPTEAQKAVDEYMKTRRTPKNAKTKHRAK